MSQVCPHCGASETYRKTHKDGRSTVVYACDTALSVSGKHYRSKACMQAEIERLTLERDAARAELIPTGPTHAPPGYEAEIVESDGFRCLSWGKAGERRTLVDLYGLPCLFMGVLAQRDKAMAERDKAWAAMALKPADAGGESK